MTTTPPPAFFVPASRRACTRPSVFPVDPREIGRRFCRGCSRWLTSRHWTTAKGNEENRCDACMRVAWRRYNETARKRVVEPMGNVPKGWGFA